MDGDTSSNEAMLAIGQARERAEAAATGAEEANRKANSESGFAFNAKQNAEEHAKAIAQLRGTVDADSTWLTTTKANAEQVVQAINTAKNAAEADARTASEAKGKSEADALTAKIASDRAAAAVPIAEKAQADAATTLAEVTSGAAAVLAAKAAAEANATATQTTQGQVAETASKANADAASIAKSESDAKALLASMSEVVAAAKSAENRVVEYEKKLVDLHKAFTEMHTKIEGLLPNATSAGLASAFRNQQARFRKPQRNWLGAFVVTIILLLCAGLVGLPGFWPGATQENWDSILRHFVARLPIVVPLVWFGIYAGRNYMLALRVEEEYAYKEAVSTAFEGYKREMSSISGAGSGALTPIVSLCESVLRTLSQRPGSIYEGRHDDITPLSPLAKTVVDAAQNGKVP